MKKLLSVVAILLVLGVLAVTFIPTSVHASEGDSVGDLKDPHFHTGTLTTCCNEIEQACDSEGPMD